MSVDSFLGLPFNIASYALLTHIFAQLLNLTPGKLVFNGGDVHIYSNHIEQVKEQLSREVREFPTLFFPRFDTLEEYCNSSVEDFILEGYNPHSTIKAPMAV